MFGRSREKPKSLGFKETSKVFRKEIKIARKTKNSGECLAKYQELKADIDSVFAGDDQYIKDVQRAAEKANTQNDGKLAFIQSPNFASTGVFGTIFLPPIYSVATLASLAVILVPAALVLTGALLFGTRHLIFRKRSKELGMTVRDIKYAGKIRKQQTKVDQAVKAMTEFDTEQPEVKKLAALRAKFAARATQTTQPANDAPAAANNPVAKTSAPAL